MTSRESRPRLAAPPGMCDCHMHIYDKRFPAAPTAAYIPDDAPVSAYMKVRERLGIARNIVVQPTTYGNDNRCTLDALAAMGDSARATIAPDMSMSDDELVRLDKLGVRGLRFFMLCSDPPWGILEPMAARVAPLGWHVQVQLDGRTLPDYAARLKRVTSTMVIDHTGKFLEPVAPDHRSFRELVGLVESGRTYVKLSAPYETSKVGPPYYDDVGALAKVLVQAAPDRMLWASNWPHPRPGAPKPDDALVLDMLLDWVPDERTRHKVLVDNPARLYGYSS
jgi:D-galactarolactone isomerase